MSDPHVVSLRYMFASRNQFDRFSKATPIKSTLDDFDLELVDGVRTATPQAPRRDRRRGSAAGA